MLAAAIGFAAAPPDTGKNMQPLLAYEGTWKVSRAGTPKPDTLINKCALLGQFFVCAQNVNGEPGPLLVFLQQGAPGHYLTQTIMPSGRATGLTDLTITADTWTYLSRQNEAGTTTYYKTINAFSGKNKIHFENSHSSNGKDFTPDSSGDELKVTK